MEPVKISKSELSVKIIDGLFMVNRFLLRTANKQIDEHNLTQSQFSVLAEIVKKGNISQKEIISEFLIEKPNLSKTIKKLAGMELINVSVSKSDGRKSLLNATPKGKQLFVESVARLNNLKELFTAPLSREELEQILSSIQKLEKLVQLHIKQVKNKEV